MKLRRIKVLLAAISVPLLIASCTGKSQPRLGFVSEVGEYVIVAPSHVLQVFEHDGRINYRLTAASAAWGPAEPPIEPGTPWFAFIETPDRVWVYDGKEDLTLLAKNERSVGVYSLRVCGSRLRDQVPAEVGARVPALLSSEDDAPADA